MIWVVVGRSLGKICFERVMFELSPEKTQEFVRRKKRKGKWMEEESRYLSVFVRTISVANGSNPTQTSFSKRHLAHVAGK